MDAADEAVDAVDASEAVEASEVVMACSVVVAAVVAVAFVAEIGGDGHAVTGEEGKWGNGEGAGVVVDGGCCGFDAGTKNMPKPFSSLLPFSSNSAGPAVTSRDRTIALSSQARPIMSVILRGTQKTPFTPS